MFGCMALAIGLHIGTYHFDRAQGLNDFNPGIYADCDNVVIGTYINSLEKRSNYVAYNFERVAGPFSAAIGVVTGYKEKPIILFIPSYKSNSGFRFGLLLPVKELGGGGIHVTYEF